MFYNMSNPLRFVDDSKRDNQQKKKKKGWLIEEPNGQSKIEGNTKRRKGGAQEDEFFSRFICNVVLCPAH